LKYDNKQLGDWFTLKKHRERNKKAKTEIQAKDVGNMDDFETPKKVGLPTNQTLKQLPNASIQSAFNTFFRPAMINGEQMLSSSLGPRPLF